MTFRSLLAQEFRSYAALSHKQLDQLEGHYELLMRWNRRINLSRFRSLTELVHLHYCESLFLGLQLPPSPLRIVDVGSGAGFPGVPIAVIRPESTVTLVESHQRKGVFLQEAARLVETIIVVTSRAEKLALTFDWQVSRAVRLADFDKYQLANCLAALVGAKDAANFSRKEILPWGEDRYIAFHVKHP